MAKRIPQEKNLAIQVFLDNLFPRFTLLKHIKDTRYDACGTIRDKRVPKVCILHKKKDVQKNHADITNFVTNIVSRLNTIFTEISVCTLEIAHFY